MPPSSTSKLILLQDQIEVAIEEHGRLLEAGSNVLEEDTHEIWQNLATSRDSLKALEDEQLELEARRINKQDKLLHQSRQSLNKLFGNHSKLLDLWVSVSDSDVTSLRLDARPVPSPLAKSVRFNADPIALQVTAQPYHDEPSDYSSAAASSFPAYRDEVDGVNQNVDQESEQSLFLQQQQTMRDQDAHLDRLSASVGRQRELGLQIDDELSTHVRLLDDLESQTDSSQLRLAQARKSLDVFSRRMRENGSTLTIFMLILVLVIVFVLLK